MWHTPHPTQYWAPPTQHFIPPFSQPSTETPNEKYPPLIHTRPLVLGQVYVPHIDDDGSATASPSTTRCSSSTDDTQKIFTSSRLGTDRMMTPPPVCEMRKQLMTREVLMMSPDTFPYAAPFYPVNQSRNGGDGNQRQKDIYRQLSRPPPPLEVAPYRPLRKMWEKDFTDGAEAPDLPILGFYARKLVLCDCTWDEDELMHLSRAFVWRASKPGQPTDRLAAFASEARQVFRIAPWNETDKNFQRCVWNVVRETFVSSWHFEEQKTSRQAVTYIKDPLPSYKEYVASALSLCSFIGDLFRYDFIARLDTVGCVRVLMHNLTTVEHITAIYNIIKHAGVPLWQQALNLDTEVSEFKKVLLEKSRPLKDYRTLLLQPTQGNMGVGSRVNDILGHVENCRLAVVDPRRMPAT